MGGRCAESFYKLVFGSGSGQGAYGLRTHLMAPSCFLWKIS